MRRALAAVGLSALCLALALRVGAADTPPPDEATRAAMHEIFGALSEILPRCLSNERF